ITNDQCPMTNVQCPTATGAVILVIGHWSLVIGHFGGVMPPLLQSDIPGLPVRRGKVRDCYDLGDGRLVLVATDRLSAFDWVLPPPIPDKGRLLTQLSLFWFGLLADVPNHVLGTELADMGPEFLRRRDVLEGRTLLVRKARVVPIECVARGYLAGSG